MCSELSINHGASENVYDEELETLTIKSVRFQLLVDAQDPPFTLAHACDEEIASAISE